MPQRGVRVEIAGRGERLLGRRHGVVERRRVEQRHLLRIVRIIAISHDTLPTQESWTGIV